MAYTFLKKILKKIAPQWLLNRYEGYIRNFVYLFYIGRAYRCNLCDANLSKFIGNEGICPRCGSLPRGRRLFSLLETVINQREEKRREEKTTILHLSPSGSLKRKISSSFTSIDYHTSDYVGEFDAQDNFDLRKTNLPANQFDIVICYHILEHIVEDMEAMGEIYRILKSGGVCFIQTPFSSLGGISVEDYSIVTPEERLKHFGQIDHVRIYSVNDLRQRLALVGLPTQLLSFTPKESVNSFGYKDQEYVLVGEKS